jgi:alkylation response protein AidB-like acyl-CoA dehydrogenase
MLSASIDMDRVRELSLTRDALDVETWRALSEMGLVGLTIDERYGGAGSSFADVAVVFEELGRTVAPVPLLSVLMAGSVIEDLADDEQKTLLLPGIASGDVIAALAVGEDAHTGDLESLATTAERTSDGWRITGTKRFVTAAPNADLFVVVAATSEGPAVFVVLAEDDGVTIVPTPALDATRPLGEVILDVLVEDSARLSHGDTDSAIRRALDRGVVALAQEQVGGAQRCLEASVEYATTRYQFGRSIGSFQAVKHKCADMLVAVEHAKSAAWHAATTIDDPEEAPISVPLARSVCSDAYLFVAGENIQIHGGIGFAWEHDAHLYFKRAKSTTLILGSVETYRDRLGDALGV